MLPRIGFAFCVLISVAAHAQQSPAPVAEPQYMYQFAALGSDGSLLSLESQKLTIQTDTHNRFVYVKGSSERTVPGEHSPVRLPVNVTFVVKWVQGMDSIDPNTIVKLRPFVIQKGLRTLPMHSGKAVIFAGVKSQTTADNSLPVTFKKYGQNSLLITPTAPLPVGEYVLEANGGLTTGVSCFGVDPGLASYTAPPPPAKIQPPVWKVKPVDHPDNNTDSYQATLTGISEAARRRGAARFDIACSVHRFSGGAGITASLEATLKVQREMVTFPTDSLTCQGDGATGAPFLRARIGAATEQTRNLCFDGELPADAKQIVEFGVSDDVLLTSILHSSGEPLTLKIRPVDGGADALTTTFQLPDNEAEVLAAFGACLTILEADRNKKADAMVVACPDLPNQKLSGVDVLLGTAMKKLKADPENAIGIAWEIPKPTKSRPSVPELTLACAYQDQPGAATRSTPSSATVKKLLPIPSTAKLCVFRQDENTNAPYGNCSKD